MRSLAALLLALLAGCGSPEPTVIDGSSQEAFERTTKVARADIPVADRLYYDRALHTVGGRWNAQRDSESLARTAFDGMTAEQVVTDQKEREAIGN
jgi:hypothetical protein